MDYLRSCYSVESVFTLDASTLVDTIDWYFVDGNPRFIGPHRFGSLNWGRNRFGYPPGVLGEVVGAPRPWRNGSMTGPHTGAGLCGDPAWYREGVPTSAVRPITLDINGDPACCTGLAPAIFPLMPVGPPNTTHIVDFNGSTSVGVWTGSGPTWNYPFSTTPNVYAWTAVTFPAARHRDCGRLRHFIGRNGFTGVTRTLTCTAISGGVRTWVDPTGVVVPLGGHVTEFPTP